MRRATQWILRHSTLTKVIVSFVLMSGLIAAMGVLAEPFRAASGGYDFFDQQFPITQEKILAQLPTYTDEARNLYIQFMVIDYLFPPMAGLFTALFWGWLLTLTDAPLSIESPIVAWCCFRSSRHCWTG